MHSISKFNADVLYSSSENATKEHSMVVTPQCTTKNKNLRGTKPMLSQNAGSDLENRQPSCPLSIGKSLSLSYKVILYIIN